MKPLLILQIVMFLICGCKKHRNTDPVTSLPAISQEGKETFGCMLNGKVYETNGSFLSAPIQCNYERNEFENNKMVFALSGRRTDKNGGCPQAQSISLYTDSLDIIQGKTYNLTLSGSGVSSAQYFISAGCGNFLYYKTNELAGGEMNIHFFDSVYQIVSGTFWFNAVLENGDTARVTDGRFDVHYIQ